MDWFLYDNGLRHERVNEMIHEAKSLHGTVQAFSVMFWYLQKLLTKFFKLERCFKNTWTQHFLLECYYKCMKNLIKHLRWNFLRK